MPASAADAESWQDGIAEDRDTGQVSLVWLRKASEDGSGIYMECRSHEMLPFTLHVNWNKPVDEDNMNQKFTDTLVVDYRVDDGEIQLFKFIVVRGTAPSSTYVTEGFGQSLKGFINEIRSGSTLKMRAPFSGKVPWDDNDYARMEISLIGADEAIGAFLERCETELGITLGTRIDTVAMPDDLRLGVRGLFRIRNKADY